MSAIPPTDNSVVLPPKKSRTGRIVAIIAAIVVVIVAAVLIIVNVTKADAPAADGAVASGLGSAADPVKLGVVDSSEIYWSTFRDAAEAEGISVDIINFGEYPLPNPALTAGELDLNQFQHIIYLAEYNVQAGEDLTPIGSTAIYPLSLYSTQYDSVEDIPDGSTVAIPDDPSNLSRSLLVLQSAGLVTLTDGGSAYSTLDDIDTADSKVTVTTLEASLTPTSLPDVAAAVINNNFVTDAGLTADEAIASDDPTDPNALPYVNLFASRAEDKDNEVLLKLVDIFQNDQDVIDGLVEASGGTAIPLKTPVSELEDSLAKVEKDKEALG